MEYLGWNTIKIVDLAEGLNEILLISCIYVSTYIYSNEWTVFLNYLETCSSKLKSINILIDVLVIIFANLGTLSIAGYQWFYLYSSGAEKYTMYFSFYSCNIYHTFLCSFLYHTATILIGTQNELINKVKMTKSCSKALLVHDCNKFCKRLKKLTIAFSEICVNIKNLNILFGYHILLMFSEFVLNVLLFVNFLYVHKKQFDDHLMTTSDLLRTLLYTVSKLT